MPNPETSAPIATQHSILYSNDLDELSAHYPTEIRAIQMVWCSYILATPEQITGKCVCSSVVSAVIHSQVLSLQLPMDYCSHSVSGLPADYCCNICFLRVHFTAFLLGYYSTSHSIFSKIKDYFRQLFLWPPLYLTILLHMAKVVFICIYIFLFSFVITSLSIQTSVFPSRNVQIGINGKHTVSHSNLLVLLPPCILSCHIILFTANYE